MQDHRLVTIGNAGHMIHHDNPERLADVVITFLGL
jgi:pimeloyl-ACP methyl ester carboxylesterase